MRIGSRRVLGALLVVACAAPAAHAQEAAPAAVLFENVRVFDGTSDRLSAPSNVLVVGNVIQAISTAPIAAPPGAALTRIARRRPHADARADRRPHAPHVRDGAAGRRS